MSSQASNTEFRITEEAVATLPVETVEDALKVYEEEISGGGNRITQIVYGIINNLADNALIIGLIAGGTSALTLNIMNQDGAGSAAWIVAFMLVGSGKLLKMAMLPGEKLKSDLEQSSNWAKENFDKKRQEAADKAKN